MQEDYIDANFKFQSYIQLDTVRKEAGLSFSLKFVGKIVNFGEDFSAKAAWVKQTEETRNTTLETIRRQSRVRSVGGPNVHLLMAVDGKASMADNLAILENDGVEAFWLYELITPENLPSIPIQMVAAVQDLVANATVTYYEQNSLKGCTDPDAANFNFQVIIDDGQCEKEYNNYTFGGVFQTCVTHGNTQAQQDSCGSFRQKNSFTGDFSCPQEYEPVLIADIWHPLPDGRSCTTRLAFKHCETRKTSLNLRPHWCRLRSGQSVPTGTGVMFGGLYTSSELNAFTGRSGCPGHYEHNRFLLHSTVCLSRNYDADHRFSIAFGGFFS